MPPPSLRTHFGKWLVVAVFAAMLLAAATVAYRLPVEGYSVACEKVTLISCELVRDTFSGLKTSQVALGPKAIATVKVVPVRRGSARVFLYLNSGSQAVFAAEFEAGAAVAQAEAAATELNRVFSSTTHAHAHVVTRPPPYFSWLMWGAVGFFGLLALAVYQALFTPKERAVD